MNDDNNQPPSASFEITTARVKKMIAFPDYQDFSVKGLDWLDNERQIQSSNIRRKVKVAKESFPMKLYRMLEQLESSGLSNVASFQPHGRAIRIHDRELFQNDVLHQYFPDNANIESFQRQLNLYDFLRMKKSGADRDSYYHAMFLKGRPDLCSLMKRPLTSSYSKRQVYDSKTEPDFYAMPTISFLPDWREENYTYANMIYEKVRQHDEMHDQMLSRASHDNDTTKLPTNKDFDDIFGIPASVIATVPEVVNLYDPKTEPDFYALPSISFLPNCFAESHNSFNIESEKRRHDEIPDRMLSKTSHVNDTAEIPTYKDNDDIIGIAASVIATIAEVGDSHRYSPRKRRKQSGYTSSQLRNKSNIEIYGQEEVDSESNYSLSSSHHSTATKVSSSSRANATMTVMNMDCTATKNSSVPAEVVAAATSILASPTLLHANMDPSYAIVDQYCRNVALKVLYDLNYCCPTSAETVATATEHGIRQQQGTSSRSSDDHPLHHDAMTNELDTNSSQPQPFPKST